LEFERGFRKRVPADIKRPKTILKKRQKAYRLSILFGQDNAIPIDGIDKYTGLSFFIADAETQGGFA
jgi:hypothetical protein